MIDHYFFTNTNLIHSNLVTIKVTIDLELISFFTKRYEIIVQLKQNTIEVIKDMLLLFN